MLDFLEENVLPYVGLITVLAFIVAVIAESTL